MDSPLKIGMFGGTFSPPHNGHVSAVRTMLRCVRPDIMYIMPAGVPPHKQVEGRVSSEIRLEMTRAAFESIDERITVSDYEITKPGASYTSETLKYLRHLHPNGEIYLFCGTDMFLSLPSWHEAEYIFAAAHIVCVYRDDRSVEVNAAAEQFSRDYSARITVITEPPREMSSSDVRRAVSRGESPSDYVPAAVAHIIEREELYK